MRNKAWTSEKKPVSEEIRVARRERRESALEHLATVAPAESPFSLMREKCVPFSPQRNPWEPF